MDESWRRSRKWRIFVSNNDSNLSNQRGLKIVTSINSPDEVSMSEMNDTYKRWYSAQPSRPPPTQRFFIGCPFQLRHYFSKPLLSDNMYATMSNNVSVPFYILLNQLNCFYQATTRAYSGAQERDPRTAGRARVGGVGFVLYVMHIHKIIQRRRRRRDYCLLAY